MRKVTQRMVDGEAREEDADLLKSIADQIAGRMICAFGEAASWPVKFYRQVQRRICRKGSRASRSP